MKNNSVISEERMKAIKKSMDEASHPKTQTISPTMLAYCVQIACDSWKVSKR